MEIYLIRHGIAAARGTYADDEQRPLTEKGCIKTSKVANKLLSVGLKFDLILTSPLVRACQTAEILKQAGLAKHMQEFNPLKPDGDIQQWLEWQQQWYRENPNGKLALVGHQPDLGNWAELLVWGTVKEQLILKKAGVIGLKMPGIGTPLCRSTLFLLISPKWLLI